MALLSLAFEKALFNIQRKCSSLIQANYFALKQQMFLVRFCRRFGLHPIRKLQKKKYISWPTCREKPNFNVIRATEQLAQNRNSVTHTSKKSKEATQTSLGVLRESCFVYLCVIGGYVLSAKSNWVVIVNRKVEIE